MKISKQFYRTMMTSCFALLFIWTGVANATLINRGAGLIYDTDLDITWLQDANYAKSSGYDADGKMNFQNAKAWAEQLVFGGYDDWRLPKGFPLGESYINSFKYDGSTDWGFNVTPETEKRSELAYLFYKELGNLSKYDTNGKARESGSYGLINTGPFINLLSNTEDYWTGTVVKKGDGRALRFSFSDVGRGGASGLKGRDYQSYEFNVWAVRDGDVTPIPEPSAIYLLGVGVCSIFFTRRRLLMFNKKS